MTESDALELARRVAAESGPLWLEPVRVTRKRRWFRFVGWVVCSNAGGRGRNVQVEIDDATGDVLRGAFLPR